MKGNWTHMRKPTYPATVLASVILLCIAWTGFPQQVAGQAEAPQVPLRGATNGPRPPVFFPESWKPVSAERPINPGIVKSPDVELKLYWAGAAGKDFEHTLHIHT